LRPSTSSAPTRRIAAGLTTLEHRADVQERKRREEVHAQQEAERAEYQRKRQEAIDSADREAQARA
jgi:hypothetical protein